MTRTILGATLAAMLAGLAAPAAAQGAGPSRAALFESLRDCRKLTEDAARLACFDAAVGAMTQAEAAGDITVVDRGQARAARKQAFGLDLPALSIFNRGESQADLDRVTTLVKTAREDGGGRWIITLEDGAVWRQIDDQIVPSPPKAGSKAEIRKAAMGSYFMNLDGQRAIRARRSQ